MLARVVIDGFFDQTVSLTLDGLMLSVLKEAEGISESFNENNVTTLNDRILLLSSLIFNPFALNG